MRMRKITYLLPETIRTLCDKGSLLVAGLLLLSFGLPAQAQNPIGFIDSLTTILVGQEAGSEAQLATADVLREQLFSTLRNEKSKLSKEERTQLWLTISNLETKSGAYTALRPKNEVSAEVLTLEKELQRLQDSIIRIQDQLTGIIEAPASSTKTKEKAVQVLATIHRGEVIEYLLDNEKRLRFGPLDPMGDFYDEENMRTAMLVLHENYFPESEINWMIFPYLLKQLDSEGISEIGMIRRLYGYGGNSVNAPWLLLEFMRENAGTLAVRKLVESALKELNIPEERRN